ncbi:MAG: hypothetical protein IPO76_02005 [Elusimicrobia bacterium]|nr:hypothetical protein [Elusimicrobiota bacterium]
MKKSSTVWRARIPAAPAASRRPIAKVAAARVRGRAVMKSANTGTATSARKARRILRTSAAIPGF